MWHPRKAPTFVFVVFLAACAPALMWLRRGQEPDVDPNVLNDPVNAVVFGSLEDVKMHVEKDPKLLERMVAGRTLLHWAADENRPEVVRYLLEKGARVDRGYDYTSLYLAASSMKAFPVKTARILIEHGADVNWRMGDGDLSAQHALRIRAGLGLAGGLSHPRGVTQATSRSVLDEAATRGHAGLVKLLLKKGASPFSYFTDRGKKYLWHTSLHRACEGPIAGGYMLPPYMARPGRPSYIAEYQDNHKVIELLVPVVKDVNIRVRGGRTPLHVAALRSMDKIADYLLTKYPKVDINAKDNRGNTPLHLAIWNPKGRTRPDSGFLRGVPDSVLNRNAEERIVQTIRALLKHKPDLTIKNNAGQTPRDRARASGNKAILALFP